MINLEIEKGLVVDSLAFSAKGKYLVAALSNLSFRLWDLNKAEMLAEIPKAHHSEIIKIHYPLSSKNIITIDANSTIILWDVVKLVEFNKLGPYFKTGKTYLAEVSKDGRFVAMASQNYFLVLDLDDESIVIRENAYNAHIVSMSFSLCGGKLVISGLGSTKLKQYNLIQRKLDCIYLVDLPENSKDKKIYVTLGWYGNFLMACTDSMCYVYSMDGGKNAGNEYVGGSLGAVSFFPSMKYFMRFSDNKIVLHSFDKDEGGCEDGGGNEVVFEKSLRGSKGVFQKVVLCPNGSFIASYGARENHIEIFRIVYEFEDEEKNKNIF